MWVLTESGVVEWQPIIELRVKKMTGKMAIIERATRTSPGCLESCFVLYLIRDVTETQLKEVHDPTTFRNPPTLCLVFFQGEKKGAPELSRYRANRTEEAYALPHERTDRPISLRSLVLFLSLLYLCSARRGGGRLEGLTCSVYNCY